jgi:hypothetical protein
MQKNVVLNYRNDPENEFIDYAQAYQEAADKLFDLFDSTLGYSDLDALPIIFLYRHAVELCLKAIILNLKKIVEFQTWYIVNVDNQGVKKIDKKTEDFISHLKVTTHDLKQLKDLATRIINECRTHNEKFFEYIGEQLNNSTEELNLLIKLDSVSDKFRYPLDKTGNACFEKHQIIDLPRQVNILHELLTKLGYINAILEYEYDNIEEGTHLMIEGNKYLENTKMY